MNLIEKIMAKASGKKEVTAGDFIEAKIDKAMMNDITGPLSVEAFKDMMGKVVWDKEKVIIVLDHLIPACNEKAAELHRILRKFSYEQKLKNFYDVGRGGVCHQVMIEKHVKPGEIIVGADSHTCTYGALSCFATGIGSTEMGYVLLTGKLWFKVPKVINIKINGKMNPPVSPKDLILYLIGQFKSDGANYMGLEFSGETISDMSIDGRLTICNMVVEMGAKVGIIKQDQKILDFTHSSLIKFDNVKDDEQNYYKKIEYSISELEPMISCPPSVDDVRPVQEIEGISIDQAILGSCTNGRLEDLRIAAHILRKAKIKDGVRAIVVPASVDIYKSAMKEGLFDIFINSGAMVCNPTCGPCYGGHLGLLAENEVCLSSSNRNFTGRMGSPKSKVYLASPATVAASAIAGKITDPRRLEV